MYGYNYWQRLNKLWLYSQQRRERERYWAIYVWKMLEKVSTRSHSLLTTSQTKSSHWAYMWEADCQTGRLSDLPNSSTTNDQDKTFLACTLSHNGPVIHNVITQNKLNNRPHRHRHIQEETGQLCTDAECADRPNFNSLLHTTHYTPNRRPAPASTSVPDQLRLTHTSTSRITAPVDHSPQHLSGTHSKLHQVN